MAIEEDSVGLLELLAQALVLTKVVELFHYSRSRQYSVDGEMGILSTLVEGELWEVDLSGCVSY